MSSDAYDRTDLPALTKVDEVIEWRRNLSGERVVFVYGLFNILHSGHLRFLRLAKEAGTKLIVGILPDSAGAIIEQKLRVDAISVLGIADVLMLLDEDILSVLKNLKPDILVKGTEHQNSSDSEIKTLTSFGGKLMFSSGEINTTDIEQRYLAEKRTSHASLYKPNKYLERHNITHDRLLELLEKFNQTRICVVGDVIVDRYIFCDALGMSKEDPTIVVNPITDSKYLGGSGIVALHGSKLGSNSTLITIAGDDAEYKFVSGKLEHYGVESKCFIDQTRPTTKKTRYKVGSKTMLRVNDMRQHSAPHELVESMYKSFADSVGNVDLLVFSDFNYGCLPQVLVDKLTKLCIEKSIPIVADSQSSSQIGDISRFTDCMLVTPTEYEARLALSDRESGLPVIAQKLMQKSRYRNVILTLGDVGIFIHTASDGVIKTDRLPALNPTSVDVSGAGDALVITASLALVSGATAWEAAYLGSVAAALQVNQVGNEPISLEQIKLALES